MLPRCHAFLRPSSLTQKLWRRHLLGRMTAGATAKLGAAWDGRGADIALLAAALCKLGLAKSADGVEVFWRSGQGDRSCFAGSSSTPLPLQELPATQRTIFEAFPAVRVLLRLSTPRTDAVAACCDQLLVASQDAAPFYKSVVSCDKEGLREALGSPGPIIGLLLRGEALYIWGPWPGFVLTAAFYLDHVCRVQLLLGEKEVVQPPEALWLETRHKVLECAEFELGVEWDAVAAWVQGLKLPATSSPVADGTEAKLRLDLSRAHKEVAARQLDELVWNHISARAGETVLITPGDRMWADVEPDSLRSSSANVTANILHSAVYTACPEAAAVVHLHTPSVEAVSCLPEGLQAPEGSVFDGRVAYHDWEGISDDPEECPRVVAAIRSVTSCCAVLLRNHGAITWGQSVDEALQRYWQLDAACSDQLLRGREQGQNPALEDLRTRPP